MNQKEFHQKIQMKKKHFENKQRDLARQKSLTYESDEDLNQFHDLYSKIDKLTETEKETFLQLKNGFKVKFVRQYKLLTTGWKKSVWDIRMKVKGQNKITQYQKKHILDD